MQLTVVRNRTRKAWSLRVRGKVSGYEKAVVLTDVRLVVRASGVARIRAKGKREVVAWAEGQRADLAPPGHYVEAYFNPLEVDSFMVGARRVTRAAAARFTHDGKMLLLLPA